MTVNEFGAYLIGEGYTKNATRSRMDKLHGVEREWGVSLERVVQDDDQMYQTLLRAKFDERERHGKIQNALRRLYFFVNRIEFPRLKDYARRLR